MTAITAIGMLSPLGLDTAETVAALPEGEGAAFSSETHNRADGTPWFTAEVPPFDIKTYLTPKMFLDRNSALFLAACGSALHAAGCDPKGFPYGRGGIAAGTVWGGLDTLDLFFADYVNKGPRLVKPLLFPHTYANTAVSLAAMEWALTGEHFNFVTDRTASGQALCEASALIEDGRADMMLAGGMEAIGLPLLRCLAEAGPLAAGPEVPPLFRQSPPFATVPAEAGVALLLESEAAARQRGAAPLARLRGAACAGRADEALRAAIAQSGLTPGDIGWVAVSANGSADDACEAAALRACFGGTPPPVVAPLGLCGDLQGATTAFVTACAVLMLSNSFLAPIPQQAPVEGIDCVMGAPRPCPRGACVVLTASATHAVALVLDRV